MQNNIPGTVAWAEARAAKAEEELADYKQRYEALQQVLVGGTGLSAITVASELVAMRNARNVAVCSRCQKVGGCDCAVGAGSVASHVPEAALVEKLMTALKPLKAIADAYDANNLDDEARKHWGQNNEHTNARHPDTVELYNGRGGRRLLTLWHCLVAREVMRGVKP